MTDILDSIGEGVSTGLEFLTGIDPSQNTGFRFTPKELMSSFGDGANLAASNSMLGVVGGAKQLTTAAAQENSGLTGRDLLLGGGLLAAGGALLAKDMHARWRANRTYTPALTPSYGLEAMERVGLPRRLVTDTTLETFAQYPGARTRAVQVLGGKDLAESSIGLLRTKPGYPVDPVRQGRVAAVLQRYADLGPGQDGAQVDFAKVDTAFELGLFGSKPNVRGSFEGDRNLDFRQLWTRFTAGDELAEEEVASLVKSVEAVGKATEKIDSPDLSFSPIARVSGIDFVNDGVLIDTEVQLWDRYGAANPKERMRRLKALNYRALASFGTDNFRQLYDIGSRSLASEEAGRGRLLPPPVDKAGDKGPRWYHEEHENIASAFGTTTSDAKYPQYVAAVSMLSEGADWGTNVQKAVELFERMPPWAADPDFQAWVRDGVALRAGDDSTVQVYTGTKGAHWEKQFKTLFDSYTASPAPGKPGMRVQPKELKKVLRLVTEPADEVFLSTSGPKQKNFYLNLLYPETADGAVTVDRHQFAAFIGVDPGNDALFGLEGFIDDETLYDTMADAVRTVAREVGKRPHEVQAVVWETWRNLKSAHRTRGGWKIDQYDPYRLKGPNGEENVVFRALLGELNDGISDAFEASGSVLTRAPRGAGKKFSIFTSPDGKIGVYGIPTEEAVLSARHMYPAVRNANGVIQWSPKRARPIFDLPSLRSRLRRQEGAVSHTFDAVQLDAAGGPVGFRAGEWITFVAPETWRPTRRFKGAADLSRAERAAPQLNMSRAEPGDVTPENLKEALQTRAFVAISAALDDTQLPDGVVRWDPSMGEYNPKKHYDPAKAQAALQKDLEKLGVYPLRSDGIYEGVPEDSFLAFGVHPNDAKKLADKYRQDSVLINHNGAPAFLYGEHAKNPATANRVRALTGGYEVFDQDPGDFRSLSYFDEEQSALWAAVPEDPDWADENLMPFDPDEAVGSSTVSTRVMALQMPKGKGHLIGDYATELKQLGVEDIRIYSHQVNPGDNWRRVREHIYSDGVSYHSHLTADREVTSRHGVPVFVDRMEAGSLPWENQLEAERLEDRLLSDGRALLNGSVILESPGISEVGRLHEVKWERGMRPAGFTLTQGAQLPTLRSVTEIPTDVPVAALQGDKLRITSPSGLEAANELKEALLDAGVPENRVVIVDGDEFTPARHKKLLAKGRQVRDLLGRPIELAPPTREHLPFRERFGVPFETKFLGDSGPAEVPLEAISSVESAMEKVTQLFPDFLAGSQFRGFRVQALPSDELANTVMQIGSPVLFNRSYWDSPASMAKELDAQALGQAAGLAHFTPAFSADPYQHLALHELGHLVHAWFDQAASYYRGDFSKRITAIYKTNKKAGVRAGLGDYASKNSKEMFAEAFADALLNPNPLPLSREIMGAAEEMHARLSRLGRGIAR